jgi:hypothetical protein
MTIEVTAPAATEAPAVEAPLENARPDPGDARSKTPVQDLIKQLKEKRVEKVLRGKPAEDAPQTSEQKRAKAEKAAEGKPESKPEGKEPAKEPKAEKPEASAERGPDGKFLPKDPKSGDNKSKAEAAKPPEPKADKADPAVEAKVEEVSQQLEEKDVKVPDQKAGETGKQYELRLSRLLLREKQLEQKLAAAEEKSKKADDYEGLLSRIRGEEIDDAAFEKLTGKSLVQMVKDIAKGKEAGGAAFKPKSQLPPEMQEALDEIRAFKKEQEEAKAAKLKAEQETSHKEIRGRELSTVKNYLTGKADAFPYLSSLPNGDEILLDEFYATWKAKGNDARYKPDIEALAEKLENQASGHFGSVFSSEKAIEAALKNPAMRALIEKKIQAQAPAPAPAPEPEKKEPPKTLSSRVTQENPGLGKDRQLTAEEERQAMHARFAKFRELRARQGG